MRTTFSRDSLCPRLFLLDNILTDDVEWFLGLSLSTGDLDFFVENLLMRHFSLSLLSEIGPRLSELSLSSLYLSERNATS